MELINKDQFAEATNLKKVKLGFLSTFLMQLIQLDKLNDLYAGCEDKEGEEFLEALFKKLEVETIVDPSDLAHIPKDGPFIIVANHPFGGLDGIALLKVLLSQRSDFKLMANFLLQRIGRLKDYFIPVNPFESAKHLSQSFGGIRNTLQHLKNGHPIGIFPAGEVSSFQTSNQAIVDKEWSMSVLKLIHSAKVPVVPVYFYGSNSLSFQLLGMLHPALRTIKLPSELLNKKKQTVKLRIGKPISVKEQESFEDAAQLGRYLRAKTYALGSPLEVKRFFQNGLRALKKPETIIEAVPKEKLISDIASIAHNRIHKHGDFELYIAYSTDIPNILLEIGRLREITFRAMQEGTNRSVDFDEYDLYYHHLFLWDTVNQAIAGAYRIGKGHDIAMKYGKKGFYINSLFKIKSEALPILSQAVELGRSFIPEAYQRKPMGLFLLWKGILYFILKHPEYRYLIGPVSISNRYSKLSKGMMIEFIKRHYYNHELAEFFKPRKKFKFKEKERVAAILLDKADSDFQALDKFIEDIEPERFNVPVLLKKYIKQNARIIGFNVDPKFEMALDGLILLDIQDIPKNMLDGLKKDFELG